MERNVARCLIVRVDDLGAGDAREDLVAVEEPLEIQIGYQSHGWPVHKSVSITMRTPGADAELAAGFLFTEGIVAEPAQIAGVNALEANIIRVELRPGVALDLRRLERHFYTSSSCGVCGKASIAALQAGGKVLSPAAGPIFTAETIHGLGATLRRTQAVFDQTGGLHAAALFEPSGKLVDVREDVGRHNAVDKLIGAQWLAGEVPALGRRLLFVSGRASFELVQKALAASLPMLAAVGAPSSLAVELAQTYGLTLLGFVRHERFNIYAGEQRIRVRAAHDSGSADQLTLRSAALADCSA
jgi:FdhD protein